MKQWKYNMAACGKPFRELFDNKEETIEHIIDIYNHMILFLKEWKKRLSNEDKEEFEYDIDCLMQKKFQVMDFQYAWILTWQSLLNLQKS